MNIDSMLRSPSWSEWIRGGVWTVEYPSNSDDVEDPEFPIVGKLGHRERWEYYDPIIEAPEAYLRFADIRQDLWAAEKAHVGRDNGKLELFFHDYGPPTIGPAMESALDSLPLSRRLQEWEPELSLPYWQAMCQATILALAIRCYQALEIDWDQYQPLLVRALEFEDVSYFLLQEGFNVAGFKEQSLNSDDHEVDFNQRESLITFLVQVLGGGGGFGRGLRHVYPGMAYKPGEGWRPQFHFTSLVGVLWFQFYQAVAEATPIKRCAGCQIIFEANRRDQVYHSDLCRGAAAARRRYRVKQEAQQ